MTAEEDMNAAQEAYDDAKRLADLEYYRVIGGPKKDRDLAVTRIEAEYRAKVQEAKSELASVERRVHAQLGDFKRTRDTSIRIEDRSLESVTGPARRKRISSLAHLKATLDEARQRYWKERQAQ